MDIKDYYDLAEDQLKGFTRSEVRTKIMLLLKEGSKTAAELEKEMDVRASTILHSMKDMVDSGLVAKRGTLYSLTNIGRIQALLLDELLSAIVLLSMHKDYWLNHDLSAIPDHLLTEIGSLSQSYIVSSDPTAPLKSLENFMEELSRSRIVRGVSSFIAPGFPEMIEGCVRGGAQVELILTEAILEIVSSEHRLLLWDLQRFDNFRLYELEEDIHIGFTVTESLLALGLYRLDGGIDLGSELVCIGPTATAWGSSLFEHYRARSKPMSARI
ncbi:MAG: winged helix-turn-helix domain-containing protein [Methanothrix sp.]|nr:winged helix-turn-helix domain-containing protein [Methanothrix sp.]